MRGSSVGRGGLSRTRFRRTPALVLAFLAVAAGLVIIGDVPGSPVGNAAAAGSYLDGRPIRLVSQVDFVYTVSAVRTYYTGVGVGPLGTSYTIGSGSPFAGFSAMGDWSRDARDDVFNITDGVITVTLSKSTPNCVGCNGPAYTLATYNPSYYIMKGIASGDWNGDGYFDAIYAVANARYSSVDLILSTGGTPSGSIYGLGTKTDRITHIASGDFNGDGRWDAAIAVDGTLDGLSTTKYVKLILSTSSSTCATCGSYGIYTTTLVGSPVGLAMGDWDKDGLSDVIVAEQRTASDYRIQIAWGRKGVPTTPTSIPLAPLLTTTTRPLFLRAGDWNADARDDLFATYQLSMLDYEVRVTYSDSSGAADAYRARIGMTKAVYRTYYAILYSFAVGDWTGDSTRTYFDGFTGSRTFSVPVAMLVAPPFESGISNPATGTTFYTSGTTTTKTYSGYVQIGGSVAWSFQAGVDLGFVGVVAKVETEVYAGVTIQFGRDVTWSSELRYQISADKLTEPALMVVDVPYLDYEMQIVNPQTATVKINVDKFWVNLPDPNAANYVLRPVYLSNYNQYKPKDMPYISAPSIRGFGNLNSYTSDDQYTAGCQTSSQCWISATAVASYLGSGDAVLTLVAGTTSGWSFDWKVQISGEVTGGILGNGGGGKLTFSLGTGYMENTRHANSISIGGKAPELLSYDTDSYGVGYEKFGYQYNAYVRKFDIAGSGQYPASSLLVLDWKAKNLNEGYPVIASVTGRTSSTLTIAWTMANDPVHSAGYRVHWSEKASFNPDRLSPQLSTSTLSYTIPNLKAGTTYYIRVEGLYTSGYTNFSQTLVTSTLP